MFQDIRNIYICSYETHVEEISIQEGAAVQLNVSLLVRDPFYSNTLIGGAISKFLYVVNLGSIVCSNTLIIEGIKFSVIIYL